MQMSGWQIALSCMQPDLSPITIRVLNLRVRETMVSSFLVEMTSANLLKQILNSGKLVIFSGELDYNNEADALLNKDCDIGRGDL
ncbi:hypothetical protein DY000_02024761 [Brassica cretica]|uniref:Uncharacterized protein n=1 Tax=Brassica cretica TaxID=69181 RepID=A0ABQ7E094_BRACR|nr:hypothetical protein DY000_02024761 [Brassica cretica]